MTCRVLALTVGLSMAHQGATGTLDAGQQETTAPQTPQSIVETIKQRQRVGEALGRSIHEAAKVNGGELIMDSNLRNTVESGSSEFARLGRVYASDRGRACSLCVPRLTPDGQSIETVYEIAVTESLKGAPGHAPSTDYWRTDRLSGRVHCRSSDARF